MNLPTPWFLVCLQLVGSLLACADVDVDDAEPEEATTDSGCTDVYPSEQCDDQTGSIMTCGECGYAWACIGLNDAGDVVWTRTYVSCDCIGEDGYLIETKECLPL